MVQYANCPYPTKSAARIERYKLAEEEGQLEATTVQMVLAANSTQGLTSVPNPAPPSQESIPATIRLGPSPSQ